MSEQFTRPRDSTTALSTDAVRREHAICLGLPDTATWAEINAEYAEMARQSETSLLGLPVSATWAEIEAKRAALG